MKLFSTNRLPEIAVLLAKGFSYQRIETKKIVDNKLIVTFFFMNAEDCKKVVDAFYRNENVVSPYEFFKSFSSAKDIIFSYGKR